jgi:TonB family protein
METLTHAPAEEPELHLLPDLGSLQDRSRLSEAGGLSAAIHVAAIVAIFLLPKSVTTVIPRAEPHQVVHLTAPITRLTQPEPTKSKIIKEFNADAVPPRPRLRLPAALPPPARAAAPAPAPRPSPPPPNLPEAPKVETAKAPPQYNPPPVPPPPQIQPQEQPKLAFENVPQSRPPSGPPTGRVPAPASSVQEALREVVRGGVSGRLTVGDPEMLSPGIGSGINSPALPGRPGTAVELLTDPQGVDFRPYLIQIRAIVKRNWLAVYPESAKMGRQGRVSLQFRIVRNGTVTKLIVASGSGADALDRAAIASISASNTFPALPTEFKGNEIVLQFNFAYNMK